MEVIIESKSDLSDKSGASSDKSGASSSEQPSGPESSTSDVGMNREPGEIPSGVSTSSKDIDSSKPTTSGAHKEVDTRTVLLNLPQAELRLLCSLLAREGYDVDFWPIYFAFSVLLYPMNCYTLTTKNLGRWSFLIGHVLGISLCMFSVPSIHQCICLMTFFFFFFFFCCNKYK